MQPGPALRCKSSLVTRCGLSAEIRHAEQSVLLFDMAMDTNKGLRFLQHEKQILEWSAIVLVASFCIALPLLFGGCGSPDTITFITGTFVAIATGAITSILVVAYERHSDDRGFREQVAQLLGEKYQRKQLFQYLTKEPWVEEIHDDAIDKMIRIEPRGSRSLAIYADYGKRGKVEAIVKVEDEALLSANGSYWYVDGDCKGHAGRYRIQRFPSQLDRIYAFYDGTLPFDVTRGYDVWHKA